MPRARIFPAAIAAIVLACTAASGYAKDLAVDDVERGFTRNGLQLKAEVVVHRGERLLLLRIDPTGIRAVVRPDGVVDAASLDPARAMSYLPVRIDCANVTLRGDGRTSRPHAASPCLDEARLAHPKSIPVFVAFKYPAPVVVEVVVPVEVQAREPPIETSLRRGGTPPPPTPAALLGPRDLVARVRVD